LNLLRQILSPDFFVKAKRKKMANKFSIFKWIFFATSNFVIIEDMATGPQGIGRIKSILASALLALNTRKKS
jgi:hypothetical protein